MNKAELEERKRELEERLKRIKQDIGSGLDNDPEEQAIELENREVLLEIARVTEEELYRVIEELREAD